MALSAARSAVPSQPCAPARLASSHARRVLITRRPAAELDEVDPYTGEIISKASVISKAAGFTVQAGGVTWAYRKSQPKQPAAGEPGSDKLPVLCLHGLGSSSYSYRQTLAMLGEAGYEAFAPDWPGHGDSEKPSPAAYGYSRDAYIASLQAFVDAVGLSKRPFALLVQGFVLSQFGLLWALAHQASVERLFILNTPLALGSKLRPELAAYKSPLPFLRPGNKPFDGAAFAMGGSPYAMAEADAQVYAKPYADPAASQAVAASMEQLDFSGLLSAVDDGFRTWRKPSLLLFGGSDPFVDVKNAQAWLDSKRTNMRLVTATAKIGHCPQEDYPAAFQDTLEAFLCGETDTWETGRILSGKMTKRGIVG